MKRFTAYISKKEDVVAVIDNITGKRYTTLEDILDLLNLQNSISGKANNTVYEDVINNLLEIYESKKANNKAVIVGDVYTSKISLLKEIKDKIERTGKKDDGCCVGKNDYEFQ